jgi:hypothetical protein
MDMNQYFQHDSMHVLNTRRHYLSQIVRERTNSYVQYGILKGFFIHPSHWAEVVSGSYLLGTYEAGVCAILDMLKAPDRTLVDLGAADGLFGLGLVKVGAFDRSFCFDVDTATQALLRQRADELGISSKVNVFGKADQDLVALLSNEGVDLSRAVILCDIEGGEFELFDELLLEALSRSHIIIETHGFNVDKPESPGLALEQLSERASRYFHVAEIRDGLRDVRDIPIIRDWSDWDTYLSCVEARYRMMSWLWLAPKHGPAMTPYEIDDLIIDY